GLAIQAQVTEPHALQVAQPARELRTDQLSLTGGDRQAAQLGERVGDLERVPLSQMLAARPVAQCLGTEPLPLAAFTQIVRAVPGQQHAHVHLVGAGLEPTKPAEHSRKQALFPVPIAFEDPITLALAELDPGLVERDRMALAQLLELRTLPLGRAAAPGPDGALSQRQVRVRNDLVERHSQRAAEAAALRTGSERRLEGKQPGTRWAQHLEADGAAEFVRDSDALAVDVQTR